MFTEGGIFDDVVVMCFVLQGMRGLEMKEPFELQKDWKRTLQ